MKPRNYKLQITKNIILALCFLVLDVHYWCQISKDSAIWILAVGFAIFTISRILDIIHDINESIITYSGLLWLCCPYRLFHHPLLQHIRKLVTW